MKRKLVKITMALLYTIIASNIFSIENIEKPIPKVLILDFANINNSPDYQYLEISIPESCSASLSKLKKFQILDRDIWKNEVTKGFYLRTNSFDQKTAINIAKRFNADIVLIGGFAVYGAQIQTFAKAIEVSTEKILVNSKMESALDGNLFLSISKLTDEMVVEINKKLPQLTYAVTSNNAGDEIRSLISSGLMKNRSRIFEKSANISEDERWSIFTIKQKDSAAGYFALNLFVGFGLGSFIQGDTAGGLIALIGESGAIGLIIIGANINNPSTTIIGVGTGVYLGVAIFQLIRPFSFETLYNKRLRESLRITVAVSPYLNLAQNGNPIYGLGLTAKF